MRVVDGAIHIEDLGSRNGTFVNRWRSDRPPRAPFPAVIRAGHTVLVVVRDVEIYEDLHEGRWGAAMDRARRFVTVIWPASHVLSRIDPWVASVCERG